MLNCNYNWIFEKLKTEIKFKSLIVKTCLISHRISLVCLAALRRVNRRGVWRIISVHWIVDCQSCPLSGFTEARFMGRGLILPPPLFLSTSVSSLDPAFVARLHACSSDKNHTFSLFFTAPLSYRGKLGPFSLSTLGFSSSRLSLSRTLYPRRLICYQIFFFCTEVNNNKISPSLRTASVNRKKIEPLRT